MAETGKQQLRSSGSSSDESDPTRDIEGASTLKRSFECTYCKRGFTNAQALGGHMNIHRKDRAKKAKQTTAAATKKGNIYSDDPNNYMMSCRQITPIETGYANWEAPAGMMSSHHMYRPAAILSSGPAAGGYSSEYHRPPGHHYWEPNLNLRVGPAAASNDNVARNNNTEDHDNHEEGKNEDVDLELRLGPR